MAYGLVPWSGLGTIVDPFRPAGVDLSMPGAGVIDLRPDSSQLAGWALVNVPTGPFPSGGVVLADGPTESLSVARRNALQNRLGLTLDFNEGFDRTVLELLTRHATPPGDSTRWNPLQRMHDRMDRVYLGGLLIEVPSVGGGAEVFSDDFNRADSNSPGGNWVEPGGEDWDIASNKMAFVSGSSGWLLNTTSIGTADYECECNLYWSSPANIFVVGRATGSFGTDGYAAKTQDNSGIKLMLFKIVSSSHTELGAGATTVSSGFLAKLSMNGSTISNYRDGVQEDSVTDTSLTAEADFGLGSNFTPFEADNYKVYTFSMPLDTFYKRYSILNIMQPWRAPISWPAST